LLLRFSPDFNDSVVRLKLSDLSKPAVSALSFYVSSLKQNLLMLQLVRSRQLQQEMWRGPA
jgi:hypothetical protein